MNPTLSEIEQLSKDAGKILRAGYEKPLQVHHKGEVDLVTEIDHQSEAFILDNLHKHHPSHSVLAEESGLTEGDSEHAWYIDPLDGTINFAHGVPFFSVSIAYAHQGKLMMGAVYDPMRDECFSAERGAGTFLNGRPIHVSKVSSLQESLLVTGFAIISHRSVDEKINADNIENFKNFMRVSQGVRRLGSAALDLAYVAAGRMDGYWEYGIHAWDIAAGALLVEEAGGKVTSIEGNPDYFVPPYPLLASNPALHGKILGILEQV